jgi:hypothetical protein
MSQAITYRRLARAALNTAAMADDNTASMLRLMAADYAAQADRLEAAENTTAQPPHIDVLVEFAEKPEVKTSGGEHENA